MSGEERLAENIFVPRNVQKMIFLTLGQNSNLIQLQTQVITKLFYQSERGKERRETRWGEKAVAFYLTDTKVLL